MKKIFLLPIAVFVIGTSILGSIVYNIKASQKEQNKTTASLNAITYAEHMEMDFMEGVNVTDTLEQIVLSENGTVENFPEIAENMMTDCIQSIQIAPDGVVTEIYPEEGNEAGKIDLLHDKDRGEISRYARDSHALIMQGPFALKQGGEGIAVRKPVYLTDADGRETFWGFTIVIIRVPDIFADSIRGLSGFGYRYRLSKTISPWDDGYQEIYSSGGDIVNPVLYEFEMGGSRWKLEVMPKSSWEDHGYSFGVMIGGMVIVMLMTGLTWILLIFNEHRKTFQKLAVTDPLTGIYNRDGFDKRVMQYLKQHPEGPCVGAQLDIDDFKLVNDMYGHASGDAALQVLARGMQDFLPEDAVAGRNGGDEFCIFFPNRTCEQARELIETFTKLERAFTYGGETHTFSISLGFAEYPTHAKDPAQLMWYADAALYEVKRCGKHGCMEYRKGLGLEIRKQLGFALKDISENLPGAFLIYKAEPQDDEILFANREMVHLAGCENMDELFAYTNRSFKELIREDERGEVTQSIWEQIETGDFNDYVHFHLRKCDGTYLPVLDHGRIVENKRYGKVFYVLIMDWKLMERHYHESF